jgi:uncharacterized Zn finger protein
VLLSSTILINSFNTFKEIIGKEVMAMRLITEDEIREVFGEKTFSKGLIYFESGYVKTGIRKGDTLTGSVLGSVQNPYTVRITITDDIHSECTCPVGEMCKHGVALLLQWVTDKDSFVDLDHLLTLLKKRSKDELIETIHSMLESDPALASKILFSEEVKEKNITIAAISRRLDHMRKELPNFVTPEIIRELEKMKKIGDNLTEEGLLSDAAEIYLRLIEWGGDAFEEDIDDRNGMLTDVLMCCAEDFGRNAEKLSEEQKKALICRATNFIEAEDYGLEIEMLLSGLASKENMSLLETELLKKIPGECEEYYRGRVLDILTYLYEKLDMGEDALRMLRETGLTNEDDYVRLVEALMRQKKSTESFEYVQEGLQAEDIQDTRLHELYFTVLHQILLEEGKEFEVNVREATAYAVHLLSSHFNLEVFEIIKNVFQKMGKCEQLISDIREKCDDYTAAMALLFDNRFDELVDHALSATTLRPVLLVKAAEVAKRRGRIEAAKELTGKALKEGLILTGPTIDELIRLVVKESDENELKETMDSIQNIFAAEVFIDALLERNQEYGVLLLRRFIAEIRKETMERYVMKMENEYAKEMCRLWISETMRQSYEYSDDVIDILEVMKGIMEKEEWNEYISTFIEENSGEKKLLEKIRRTDLL